MTLHAIGLSHATAPLRVREQVVFPADTLAAALRDLLGQPTVEEAAILSTCNRTEVYFNGAGAEPVVQWLEGFHHVPTATLIPHLYALAPEQAVPHAFRVASGLESMVLGETQVLGQMKQAVRTAEAAGSMGPVLHRLFQHAFAVAKDVRTHTDIGSASISMAAAAVRLAERLFDSISQRHVLLIGAGEMIDLCATHFAARQPRSITVANRTMERGAKLAARVNACAIKLAELPTRLAQFDIIVTSTASALPVLGKRMIERAMKTRQHAPMFIVDLAVPRDVEPEAAALDEVYVYCLDDLAGFVRQNLQIRAEAVVRAEAMIATQAQVFLHWLEGRAVVPTISALHRHHYALCAAEIERAKRLFARGAPVEQVFEQLAHALTHKFLHGPTQALNQAGGTERTELLALFKRVYHLRDEAHGEDAR